MTENSINNVNINSVYPFFDKYWWVILILIVFFFIYRYQVEHLTEDEK